MWSVCINLTKVSFHFANFPCFEAIVTGFLLQNFLKISEWSPDGWVSGVNYIKKTGSDTQDGKRF